MGAKSDNFPCFQPILVFDIDKAILKNIDTDKWILQNIDIDKAILEDIDKDILENIDIDKISNRLEFGISNRANCQCSGVQ